MKNKEKLFISIIAIFLVLKFIFIAVIHHSSGIGRVLFECIETLVFYVIGICLIKKIIDFSKLSMEEKVEKTRMSKKETLIGVLSICVVIVLLGGDIYYHVLSYDARYLRTGIHENIESINTESGSFIEESSLAIFLMPRTMKTATYISTDTVRMIHYIQKLLTFQAELEIWELKRHYPEYHGSDNLMKEYIVLQKECDAVIRQIGDFYIIVRSAERAGVPLTEVEKQNLAQEHNLPSLKQELENYTDAMKSLLEKYAYRSVVEIVYNYCQLVLFIWVVFLGIKKKAHFYYTRLQKKEIDELKEAENEM